MSRGRGLRLLGFRLLFGLVVALATAVAMRPDVAHAVWPVNAQQCTTNMVLTAGQSLNFGKIIGSVGGGTVTVSTAGGITASGVTPTGGTVTAATFTGTDPGVNEPVNGCTAWTVTVVVGTATLTGPGTSMTVNVMTDSVTENGIGLWDYNTVPIYVGGTLNVNGNQVAGSYTGTYSITITYQ